MENNAARRTEDIALDLLKFIAAQAHVGSKPSGSTGFGVSSSAKPEDQVTQLRLRWRSSAGTE